MMLFHITVQLNRIEKKRGLFLGHLTFVITHTVYRYYRTAGFKYQIVDGIISRVEMKQNQELSILTIIKLKLFM